MSNFNIQNELDEISSNQTRSQSISKSKIFLLKITFLVNSDFHHSKMKLNSNNLFAFQVKKCLLI